MTGKDGKRGGRGSEGEEDGPFLPSDIAPASSTVYTVHFPDQLAPIKPSAKPTLVSPCSSTPKQDVERQETNRATVAVRRYLQHVRQIQRWWKVMVMVRKMQFAVSNTEGGEWEREGSGGGGRGKAYMRDGRSRGGGKGGSRGWGARRQGAAMHRECLTV